MGLSAGVLQAVGDDSRSRAVGVSAVGGGCISEAGTVRLEDGRAIFVKENAVGLLEMFEREAEGLAALGEAGAIRVPTNPWTGVAGDRSFLAMEAVETGRRGPDFWESFGRAFAGLHREATAESAGFPRDNFIGSTPQANSTCPTWTEFWRRRRLVPQLELARRRGLADGELDRLGDLLAERLGDWLEGVSEPASLLHGDLWSGNFLVDSEGAPVLIDPACYHGHREADLAMTRLFGGFDGRFYAAYEETWPLEPESEERRAIYELYHLLNHLNLFGAGYRERCVATLRRLVG